MVSPRLFATLPLLMGLASLGCAGGAGAEDAFSLELGRDDAGAFAPLAEGDAIQIERGPQGGVHLSLAVRSDVVTERALELDVSLEDPADGAQLGGTRYLLAFDGPADAGGFRVEDRIRAFLPPLDTVADRDLRVIVVLTPSEGAPLDDERTLHCVPPPP